MSARGIILSRTEMTNGYFCGCVAIERGVTWEQVRLLSAPGVHLHPNQFRVASVALRARWKPGREIFLPEPDVFEARRTHPEDRLVDPKAIRFGQQAEAAKIQSAVSAFSFGSLAELFPNVLLQGNGKAYVPGDRPSPRSVGYVPCERITVAEDEFATVRTAGGDDLTCKVKSEIFLEKIRSEQIGSGENYPARLVRLGLANPSDWEGRFNPPRCYVMLTGTIR